ncbi:MAG: N-acetylmuramoyl-L-alanine amidase, partial [bacterium]|nr:N-acetylmuramoyl-L-alanine amidase [bacterium]
MYTHKPNNQVPFILLIFSILLLNISCAVFKGSIPTYSEMTESMEDLDLTPLNGRLIVIDPGHGGEAPGAVGTGGLREKDINLTVSLKLKEYLEEAGAQVILTRETDRSLFIGRIDSLRGNDLDYRVRISNENEADLFISIHHNSNLPLNRKYNAVETYYKMEDSFSSFDAGRLIHKHLSINIQPEMNFLKPGNYYVVRSNERTAVLGEAAYISNPDIEKLLKKDEKADIEARSYFLGILDYFSYGVPEVEVIYPDHETIIPEAMPVIRISVKDDGFGGGIDIQSVRVNIDEVPASFEFDGSILSVIPGNPLQNGNHTVSIVAANRKGNHSLYHESIFNVDLPPANIMINHMPEEIPPDFKTDIAITSKILDTNLNSVRDSTKVEFSLDHIPGIQKTKYTQNGLVSFYVRHNSEDTLHYTVSAGNIDQRAHFVVSELDSPLLTVRIRTDEGNNLDNVSINLNNEQIRYTNREGRAVFQDLGQISAIRLKAKKSGFYPVNLNDNIGNRESKIVNMEMKPVYGGALSGRTIMIDPEHGGLSYGAIGPTGLRASDENYETAFYLKNYLETTGANVIISRDKDEEKSLYSRVRYANRTGAQLFVSIRYSGDPEIRHDNIIAYAYPSSS